jgi:PAS domain S-box-containing protein
MAALMRTHDWSASPLGDPSTWPQSLRSVVQLILSNRQLMFVAWGPDLAFIYNDGYAPTFGRKHPWALGRPFREVWSEIWDDVEPLVARALAGETTWNENLHLVMERNGYPEDAWFTFSYSPLHDENGDVAGMFCAGIETTSQVLAKRHRDALLRLDEQLRDVADTADLSFAASELLGEALGAVRVGYGVLDEQARTIAVERNWSAPSFVDVAGVHSFDDYGIYVHELLRGTAVANVDVESDPRTAAKADSFRALGIRAHLDVPVVEDGRAVAQMFVHCATPRVWTDEEEALVRNFAERTHGAVARREAEARLRESEARFRNMADHTPVMTWVTDAAGNCTYLNRAWYEFTGQTREEAEGFGWLDVTHPDDKTEAERVFLEANADRRPFRLEYRLRRADGSYRWAIDAAAPRFGPDGGFLGYIGSVIDIDERREIEDALRESEARFRLTADAVPQIVWITDAEGRTEFFNKQWSNYTGVPFEPTTAAEVAAGYVHPDDAAETVSAFDGARRTGTTFLVEHRIRSASGEYRWFLVRGEPYRDPTTGDVVRWFGASVDIHDRKLAEAEQRRQAEELRAIYDAAPVGLCVLDRDLRYVRINERLAEINGIPAADHIGRTVAQVVPGLSNQIMSFFRRVLDGEALIGIELTGMTAAYPGVERTWRENWVPLRGGDGAIVGMAISAEEITEEKAAAEALKASEARLRELNETLETRVAEALAERKVFADIVEGAPATIMALDLEFNILASNAAALSAIERIYGKRPKVGDNLLEMLADMPEHQAQVRATWGRALAGEDFVIVDEFGDESHERIAYEARFNALRDRDGRLIGSAHTAYDVTDRVRAQTELEATQEALRQSQKMEAIGQLTGGVAHDFNNLLTPIVGSLDMLQRKGIGGEREQRLIAGAARSAERAKTLVQRLLAFSRRQPLQPVPVDIGRLVAGMVELVSSTTGPQIEVIVDTPEDLPAARADPNQLEMALLNLSVNARDAMPDGGTLRITARAEEVGPAHGPALTPGRYVSLSVADTGVGMDEATLARAIEPFFSTKGVGKGTGLGLSMVHGLASQLGGTLAIRSRPGMGTEAELWLPVSEVAPETVDEVVEAIQPMSDAGTALLVDDEELVRMSTADMLVDLGYTVVEASSAEEALQLIGQGLQPDLLVTDHLMPGMNGTDLARIVRSERPNTSVLLVSGYAEVEGVAPDLPRLTKPFRNDELAARLAQLRAPA